MADNFVLGRGKLFFAPYATNTTTGGTKAYFGSTQKVDVTQNITKLDHYSMEGGLKVKDKSIQLQVDMTLTFDTDHISPGNLLLWFGGAADGSLPSDAPTDIGALSVIGSAASIYGALFFESDNPVGDQMNYWWPYVNIQPSGTFALKADAWQTLSFSAEALKRDASTERVYTFAPSGNISTAAGDTTSEFTTSTAGAGTSGAPATGGTVSVPGTGTASASVTATYTLTGGVTGYLAFYTAGADVGGRHLVTGASGTKVLTAPAAATYTVKLYAGASGGSALATSSNIVIS